MSNISILICEEELKTIVSRLGRQISQYYAGEEVVVCVVLKGSLVFAADLIRTMTIPVTVDFIRARSYGSGTESCGNVNITVDMETDITGKNVLLVEDIIDSGRTLLKLRELLQKRNPKSISLCTLLDKPSRRETPLKVDFSGKVIPDKFVVGYGLDWDENYRQLPYVGYIED